MTNPATGDNAVPVLPEIAGLGNFNGKLLHTSEYKNGAEFRGNKVLVLGCGNSGMEVSLDLCNSDAQVSLVVRHKLRVLPKEMLGKSTFALSMWLLKWLPLRLVDWLIMLEFRVFKICNGTLPIQGKLPSTPGSSLTWLGFSEEGQLSYFDSKIKLERERDAYYARFKLAALMNQWIPLWPLAYINSWSFIRFLGERKTTFSSARYGSQLSGAFGKLYGQSKYGIINDTVEISRPSGSVHENCINCIMPLKKAEDSTVARFSTSGLDGKVVVWDLDNQLDLSDLNMSASKLIGSVAASIVIAFTCDYYIAERKIFGGTTPSTITNKEWAAETADKKFQAWPRTAGSDSADHLFLSFSPCM